MSRPKLFVTVRPDKECRIRTMQEGSKHPNYYDFKFNVEAMHFIIRLLPDWNLDVSIYDNHPMTEEWKAFCEMRMIPHSVVSY